MATSVRLNLRVKSLFLEHTYNSISDKQEDTNISEAFKFLIISQDYLLASQKYKVYWLVLRKSDENDNYYFVLQNLDETIFSCTEVSFDGLCKLNQLLKFAYILLGFDNEITKECANEYKMLLEEHLVQAKIYLGFCDLDDPDKINWLLPFLFSAFNGRICRIEGYASIMANGPSVNVESCNVLNPKRFDDIKSILKTHQISKFVVMMLEPFDATTDSDYFDDFPTYPSLTRIKIVMYPHATGNLHKGSFENLTKMHQCFPNLELSIVRFENHLFTQTELNPREAADDVLNFIEKMSDFKTNCNPKTVFDFSCNASYEFKESWEEVETSIDYLKKHSLFEEANIQEYEPSTNVHQISYEWKHPNFHFLFDFWFRIEDKA